MKLSKKLFAFIPFIIITILGIVSLILEKYDLILQRSPKDILFGLWILSLIIFIGAIVALTHEWGGKKNQILYRIISVCINICIIVITIMFIGYAFLDYEFSTQSEHLVEKDNVKMVASVDATFFVNVYYYEYKGILFRGGKCIGEESYGFGVGNPFNSEIPMEPRSSSFTDNPSTSSDGTEDAATQPEKVTEAPTPEQVVIGVKPTVEVLNECLEEKFGANVDYTTSYMAAFTSEEAFNSGKETRDNPPVLFLMKDRSEYVNKYFLDHAEGVYYPILNYRTVNDVKAYMGRYMTEEMVNRFYRDEFASYEGRLYLMRGGRGYGAASCDLDSIKYIEEKDGIHYVSVDIMLFDTVEYTTTLGLQRSGVNFILVSEEH